MKTDYTITPEYHDALCEELDRSTDELIASINFNPPTFQVGHDYSRMAYFMQNSVGRETPEQLARMQQAAMNIYSPSSLEASPAVSHEASEWLNAYAEALRSHAAGEPLIRTVCKIAARILFVLLLVGIGVGVMLK